MKLDELRKKLNIKEKDYNHIVKNLKRYPNELELALFSATYSEHCAYRHSKKYLSNLYRKNAVYSKENAGGIEVGKHTICFKTESHNHPSAVEPFNGAATGIGGIIRDVLAMNARPILLGDSLHFGQLNNSHTKYIFEHVVEGISFYGNCTGIPTIVGETNFDIHFEKNPLVNVLAIGIAKSDNIVTSTASPNKKIMLIGSKTMRDGAGGAAFASKELNQKEADDNRFCIQIADPFAKKRLIEAMMSIFDKKLVIACQDCGAAGILSSTSEIAAKSNCGVCLNLEKVHLGDETMTPIDIMLSETQERMVVVFEEENLSDIKTILDKYNTEFSVIGETITPKDYILKYNDKIIANVPIRLLTEPPFIEVKSQKKQFNEFQNFHSSKLTTEKIYSFINNPNFASKNWIYSQYDYTVGARTTIPPQNIGASAVWLYEEDCFLGVTLHSDSYKVFINPFEGMISTFAQARRKLIASGFLPKGYTNCLNFPNPENGEIIHSFKEVVRGMNYAARKFKIPVVSGNVSFYNEFQNEQILPTPVIGMIGITNSQNFITKNYFDEGETVYVIGKQLTNSSHFAGSSYFINTNNYLGNIVDRVDFKLEKKLEDFLEATRRNNLLQTALAPTSGGIFAALFKGLAKKQLGFKLLAHEFADEEKHFFAELESRYIIGIIETNLIEEILTMNKIPYTKLGIVTNGNLEFSNICIEKEKAFRIFSNTLNNLMQ